MGVDLRTVDSMVIFQESVGFSYHALADNWRVSKEGFFRGTDLLSKQKIMKLNYKKQF